MAHSSTQFVSAADLSSAWQLTGAKLAAPLNPGETIIGHGTFDDGSETGPGVFLVLKTLPNQIYSMAPLGCDDPYWGDHLKKRRKTDVKVMKNEKEKVPATMELLRRWRVIGRPGGRCRWMI